MMKTRLLLASLCFSCMAADAQEAKIDGLNYYLFPDTHKATLNHDNECQGELVIPSEVSYNDETYIVNGISVVAFSKSRELTKVCIPKTIDHVEHIRLSDEGFVLLTPDFDMNPFSGTTALECIEVDEDNPIFKAVDGVLFSKDGTRLYCYPQGIKAESYTVPECVTWIGQAAFGSNKYIVTVELPETIEELYTTFGGCTKLENVNLPDNMTILDIDMFAGCSSLKTINIPSGVTIIGGYAFQNCSSLESIELPENVSEIGDYAFRNCTSLEEIVIPSSTNIITEGMFLGCSNLKKVTIPEGVSIVAMEAFQDCTSLKELDLPASIDIDDIGAYAFRGCKFNSLIIRGTKGFYANLNKYIFEGMDTSATIYCRASEVENIKEIYDGVVLPLEDYTSGIRTTEYLSGTHAPAYDLQGRRVNGQPTKGIYIKDGKKHVKK